MSKKYTITNIKETIKNMLLEDAEITKILLNGDENTYKNVKGLFNRYIFDYFNEAGFNTLTSSYIYFDVSKDAPRNQFRVCISVETHKNAIHRSNDNTNYLDLLTDKIIASLVNTFGEDIKHKDKIEDGISNQFIVRKDNFAERAIVFFL